MPEINPPSMPDQAEADAWSMITTAGWAAEFNAGSVVWHLKQHSLHHKYFALERACWHYAELIKAAAPYHTALAYQAIYRAGGPRNINVNKLWAARILYQLNKLLTREEQALLTPAE